MYRCNKVKWIEYAVDSEVWIYSINVWMRLAENHQFVIATAVHSSWNFILDY